MYENLTHIKLLTGEELAKMRALTADLTDALNRHTNCPEVATNALFIMAADLTVKCLEERDDYKAVRSFRQIIAKFRSDQKRQKQRSMQ